MANYSPDQPSPVRPRGGSPHSGSSLPTMIAVLVVLLAVWLLPRFVENLQFAWTRGRERAEVEIAREELAKNGAQPFVQAFEQVAKSIGPSVVHIDSVKMTDQRQDEWSYFFGGQQGRPDFSQEQGSGVIIDQAGYVLTNNHVVDGAQQVTVSLSDGRKVDADVVGADPPSDLAVVKIDADNLTPAPWGDSDALPVGAPVWAVGNPYGLDRSVTFGIISAKSRRGFGASPYQDFLQTDAAVNPGNSGGPLINVQGEVVGINTAIVGRAYQGISFAIPSSMARQVYDQLRTTNHVVRGYLGVQLDEELSPQLAKKLQLKDTHGALVKDIVPGGPAEIAGIEPGDVIVDWNGQPIDSPTTLMLLIARTDVGSTVECKLIRDGAEQTKSIAVGEMPKREHLQRRNRRR